MCSLEWSMCDRILGVEQSSCYSDFKTVLCFQGETPETKAQNDLRHIEKEKADTKLVETGIKFFSNAFTIAVQFQKGDEHA